VDSPIHQLYPPPWTSNQVLQFKVVIFRRKGKTGFEFFKCQSVFVSWLELRCSVLLLQPRKRRFGEIGLSLAGTEQPELSTGDGVQKESLLKSFKTKPASTLSVEEWASLPAVIG